MTRLARRVWALVDRLRPSRRRLDREHRATFGSGNTGWKAER